MHIDYFISAVEEVNGVIRFVTLHEATAKGDFFLNQFTKKKAGRLWIISLLKKNKIIYTTTNLNGEWINGSKVDLYEINKRPYFKTIFNNTPNDNLDNLPKIKQENE